MAIDPVAYLPPSRGIDLAPSAAPAGAGFGPWLSQALEQVSTQLAQADQATQLLASGQAQSLHQVMIALEQARLGVQLVTQVRNRLLDAYQEVVRMSL